MASFKCRVIFNAFVVVCLSTFASASNGTMYQCKGKDGVVLQNFPCSADEKVMSVDGVSQAVIERKAAELERQRLADEQRSRAVAEEADRQKIEWNNRPRKPDYSAEEWRRYYELIEKDKRRNSLEQTYRELPTASRYQNLNTSQPCRGLVDQIRELENSSDYATNSRVRQQWSILGNAAMARGCKW